MLLDAVPKTKALTMSPSEFRTAFRNRLLIPHPQLSAHTTCACGQDVDVLGVHTQKCRLDGNLTNSTHNRLVACLAEMIRSCGQSVRIEVTGIFNNVDPTRMDLAVYDPGRPNQLYDVVVTNNPVTAAVLRSNFSNLRAAWTQQRTKEKRYRVAATEAGMLLHELAIEVYGRWGDDFSYMFNHFISLGAANTNTPRAILANYWRRRISVCLQSGVANAMNTRSNRSQNFGCRRAALLQPWGSVLFWLNRGTIGGVSRRSPHRSGLWRRVNWRRDLAEQFFGPSSGP